MKKTKEKEIVKFDFTKQVLRKVRDGVLDGKTRKEIAESIGLSAESFRYHLYENTANVRSMVREYEVERMLQEAERVSSEILSVDAFNGGKRIDGKVLEVKQKEASFLREKLVKAREVYDSKNNNINVVIAPLPILGGLLDEIKEVKADVVE